MDESLIIDFKLLSELDISINSFLHLYNIQVKRELFITNIKDEEILNLQQLRLIKIINGESFLRQGAIDLLELLTINSTDVKTHNKKIVKKSNNLNNKIFDEKITEYRELWRGLKPGSMGSLQSCKDKMKRWMESNPEYTFDNIINAAKLYLRTEGMSLRFLQRADYFIYKQENNREESSRLSAFIDDVDSKDDDWTSKLI